MSISIPINNAGANYAWNNNKAVIFHDTIIPSKNW